jgi:lathosterol oxidase
MPQFDTVLSFLVSEFPVEFITRLLIFFVPASLAYLLTDRWLKKPFSKVKVQSKDFQSKKIRHDIIWSSINRFLLTFVTVGIAYAVAGEYSLIYNDPSLYGGLPYLVLSLVLVFLIHDIYFYIVHRIMHSKLLMRRVHKLHHHSTDPTPFTAYAFHPWETVIEFAFLPLIIFVIPLYPAVFLTWQAGIILFNIYGHLGYEVMPRWWVNAPILKYINTPTNHNMHHSKFNYNFGLYTNIWDRLFGTHHPEYENVFAKVKSRKNLELA